MRIYHKVLLVLVCLLFIHSGFPTASGNKRQNGKPLPKKQWVDSVYNALNQEERIGQLFMVAAYSGGKNYNEELVTKLIAAHQIGGLIFMQGGPVRQALLTNKYQEMAQVPLLIAMDGEWGLGMRLDSVRNFPRQMMLGATRDTDLVYRMGAAIAAQCNRLGVNIDFAPDVDVNNNAANPVINSRSFGEDKTHVSRLGIAYMKGLQKNGVMACAKHFPGHGDTNVDSHKDLPLITKTLDQLDTLELYPFKQLINAGVACVMVAHLEVPAIDTAKHVPTSLSATAVTTLLKNKLGFQGLVITDALGMQGVTKYFPAGEADLRALMAGNDILLFSQDVPAAIVKIKTALDSGLVSHIALEASVKKILSAKYDAGLYETKRIATEHITEDLNYYIDSLRLQVARSAITLVKDDNEILKKINENSRVGYIGINASTPTPLYNRLQDVFVNMDAAWIPKNIAKDSVKAILAGVAKYDALIVGIHNLNFSPSNNYGLSEDQSVLIKNLENNKNVMFVLMGNAYEMQSFCNAGSVMVSYEDDSLTELLVADALLRKMKAKGKLPVTACIKGYEAGNNPIPFFMPLCTPSYDLKKVFYPVDAGVIDMSALDKLDLFLQRCIADGVFPGCRILAARDGKVFYDKAFGYLMYDKHTRVDTNTIYDMASCTKILATTLAVMRLYENGKLDIEKTIGNYLPASIGTNKASLKIKDLLLHQAGLRSWIPFYKETLDPKGKLSKNIYKKKSSSEYKIPVAKNIYIRNDYSDTIWNRIYTSTLDNTGKSVYSDLDYYFLAAIVEKITGKRIDKYAEEEFYRPLGLRRMAFNPLGKFDAMHIAPTEIDVNFRNELVSGYVHDPGAAMLGGVAGHAGLFAAAHDVAVIMQMLLNGGAYGGKRYFKSATVDLFTAYRSNLNHRGYGFDKPATDADDGGPAGERCSGLAFGHQGFTGTCTWADPATGIVFVFLSNRVYPSAENTKINKLNVRTLAQDYIYSSLGIPVNHGREVIYKAQLENKDKLGRSP